MSSTSPAFPLDALDAFDEPTAAYDVLELGAPGFSLALHVLELDGSTAAWWAFEGGARWFVEPGEA